MYICVYIFKKITKGKQDVLLRTRECFVYINVKESKQTKLHTINIKIIIIKYIWSFYIIRFFILVIMNYACDRQYCYLYHLESDSHREKTKLHSIGTALLITHNGWCLYFPPAFFQLSSFLPGLRQSFKWWRCDGDDAALKKSITFKNFYLIKIIIKYINETSK